MDNAEKFELLRDLIWNQYSNNALNNAECAELQEFINEVEERWDMFDE